MKAQLNENYYRKFWDEFMKPSSEKGYMNLECQLEQNMKVFAGLGLPEDAVEKLVAVEAEKIIAETRKKLIETKHMIERLDSGESTLGYTTYRQEIEQRGAMRKRWEFNCLQLSDFTKKYRG